VEQAGLTLADINSLNLAMTVGALVPSM